MNIKLYALCLLVSLAGISCRKDEAPATTNGQDKEDTAVVKLKYESVDDIPAELRTEAVDYFGLLNETERTYKYWKIDGDAPDIGWERVRFLPSADGNPQFEFLRTGSLLELADEIVDLRSDGIYSVKTGLGPQEAPWRYLPHDVEVGSTWHDVLDVHHTARNRDIVQSMDFSAVAIESTTVEAGTYSTLVVETRIVLQIDGVVFEQSKPQVITIRYAKGVGIVLLEMRGIDGSGNSVEHRIELIDDGMPKKAVEEGDEQ